MKRLKVLTDHLNRIGTDTDDHDFRLEVHKELGSTANLATQLKESIARYGLIEVPFAQQADRNDKQQAYTQKLSELVGKFQDVTKKIKDKEQLYIELAQKRRQTLISSFRSENADLEKNKHQQQLQKEQTKALKIKAETDYITDVINQR